MTKHGLRVRKPDWRTECKECGDWMYLSELDSSFESIPDAYETFTNEYAHAQHTNTDGTGCDKEAYYYESDWEKV